MAQEIGTRFDDLVLDAVTVILALARRGKGWDAAKRKDKGRMIELGRGLAGERRYALKVGDAALVDRIDALRTSARAQLRMLEGNPDPGDAQLAARLESDVAEYQKAARREASSPPGQSLPARRPENGRSRRPPPARRSPPQSHGDRGAGKDERAARRSRHPEGLMEHEAAEQRRDEGLEERQVGGVRGAHIP